MAALLGWTIEELLSASSGDKIHPDDQARVRTTLDQFIISGKLSIELEYRLRCKDGSYRWLAWKKALSSEDGLLVCVGRDVTEQRRYEDRIANELLANRIELKHAEAEVESLAASLLSAQEDERRRIARDLHDSVIQQLAVIAIELNRIGESSEVDPDHILVQLGSLYGRVQTLVTEVREISHKLHPDALDHLGLPAALQGLADDFRVKEQIEVLCDTCQVSEITLPIATSTCLYRIAQESLVNASKHAIVPHSPLQVKVTLQVQDNILILSVQDNGHGIDETSLLHRKGMGLGSMRERARSLGGSVNVSRLELGGTIVVAKLPY